MQRRNYPGFHVSTEWRGHLLGRMSYSRREDKWQRHRGVLHSVANREKQKLFFVPIRELNAKTCIIDDQVLGSFVDSPFLITSLRSFRITDSDFTD